MFREHPIEWDDAKVARLWNWYSRTSPYRDIYFAKRFGDLILRACTVPLRESLTVLDFGCGPGFLWDHIDQLNAAWRYIGADFSSDSTRQLNERAAGNPRFVAAHLLEQLPVPLAESSVDAVFLVEVVEHVDDRYLEPTLHEMRRVLKPGGKLVVTTPNAEDLAASTRLCPECGAIFHEWQHVRTWDAASLARYVARFGFTPLRVEPRDFFARNIARTAFNGLRRLVNGAAKPHLLGVFTR
ncbi:MAG TPA: methyltransferase domain-containing protein [Burkholderiaceae bacterium]|nr:methyltransferase domain-containing protein [Burkholderiaceae bacterium]